MERVLAQIRRPSVRFPAHRVLPGTLGLHSALIAVALWCAGCQTGGVPPAGTPDVVADPPARTTPATAADAPQVAPTDAATPASNAPPAEAVHGPNASNAAVDPASATTTVAVPDRASGTAATGTAIIPPAVDPVLGLEGRVVYGVRRTARNGAVIDMCRCFQQIPAYQRIRREDLPRTRADYHFLMTQATSQFEDAVEAVALRAEVELVIVPDKNVVLPEGTRDLTDEVVAWLRGAH